MVVGLVKVGQSAPYIRVLIYLQIHLSDPFARKSL